MVDAIKSVVNGPIDSVLLLLFHLLLHGSSGLGFGPALSSKMAFLSASRASALLLSFLKTQNYTIL